MQRQSVWGLDCFRLVPRRPGFWAGLFGGVPGAARSAGATGWWDQSITAISKNYRRSVNTQIIICAHRRRVVAVSPCSPGNRNDVIAARQTVAHLFDSQVILGDNGYRGIGSITTPRRDHTDRIIHDHHYRAHRRIRARVEHVIARLNDWQILRQRRRRGDAINHNLHNITGLLNLKNHPQLRVDS